MKYRARVHRPIRNGIVQYKSRTFHVFVNDVKVFIDKNKDQRSDYYVLSKLRRRFFPDLSEVVRDYEVYKVFQSNFPEAED